MESETRNYAKAADSLGLISGLLRVGRKLNPVLAAADVLHDPKNGQRWNPLMAPYMHDPMNMLASRDVQQIVFIGPSRSSKTFSMVNGSLAYVLTQDPGETAIVQMNQGQALDFAKADIDRCIDASPKLNALRLRGVKNNTVFLKTFSNGMTLRMLWPSPSSLSGKTIRYVFIVDADNATGDLSTTETFALAQKRTATYYSAGKTVAEGSPAVDYSDPNYKSSGHSSPNCDGLMGLYDGGNRAQRYWPCPHCGEYFSTVGGPAIFGVPDLKQQIELLGNHDPIDLAEKFCRIPCPHCGSLIEQSSRESMEPKGVWLADGQTITAKGEVTGEFFRGPRASFWLGGVCAFANSWRDMLWRYFSEVKSYIGSGLDKGVKHILNTDFAYPHCPFSIQLRGNDSEFQDRFEDLPKMLVPPQVKFLVASVDVQSNRFEVKVTGFADGLESWPIDYYQLRHRDEDENDPDKGLIPIDPVSRQEDWQRLKQKVINRRYLLSDSSGRSMPVLMTFIDSGGGYKKDAGGKRTVTANAYHFYRTLDARERKKTRLIKGGSGKERVKESLVENEIPLILLGSDQIKDEVFASLYRDTEGQGYMHLSKWMAGAYIDGLSKSETRTTKGWVQTKGRRNEPFDLACYCRAAAIYLEADRPEFWRNPPAWAQPQSQNPLVTEQAVHSPKQRGARNGGVSVWG